MSSPKYSLEPYRGKATRHTCPQCNKKNQFTFYIDNHTGEPLHDDVGKCNFETCYHYTPKQFFLDNPDRQSSAAPIRRPIKPPPPPKQIDYIDIGLFNATLKAYHLNTFVLWLSSVFGTDKAHQVAKLYKLGTTSKGECIFWQVDRQKRIRTGKVRRYNSTTGKSLSIDWIHSRIEKQRNLEQGTINHQQIYFGSHLLELPENQGKTVAIVEGEKTAVFMAVAMPQYIWIASGGGSNFGIDCKVNFSHLKDFTAIVFPDSGKFESWQGKAERARHQGFKIAVSDFIEKKHNVGEVGNNADLIDYYLPIYLAEKRTQLDTPKKERKEAPKKEHQEQEKTTNSTHIKGDKASTKDDKTDKNEPLSKLIETFGEIEPEPLDWQTANFKPYLSDDKPKTYQNIHESQIIDLRRFFLSLTAIPDKIVLLNAGEVVTDLQKCIDRQLSCIDESSGAVRLTYIDRLKEIRQAIELHQFADAI